jgi:hypothetical protein
MPVYPEKLLIKRYQLQSELWGLGQEIHRIELEAQPLRLRLNTLDASMGGGNHRKWQAIVDQLRPLKERLRILSEALTAKRAELLTVESQLRETFRNMGKSLALESEANDDEKPKLAVEAIPQFKSRYAYDVFIPHASEDKVDVVRPLVTELSNLGVTSWYDENVLTLGDSIRKTIDHGLLQCRFGVVIVSPFFVSKRWPEYEFNGLIAREMETGKVILPVWHNITKNVLLQNYPNLADRYALSTANSTIENIALSIADQVYKSIEADRALK